MKKMYETIMINTGGREGIAYSPDHSFEMKMVQPGMKSEGATNPEQLFAAGFSACFNGALGLVMKGEGVKAEHTLSATVSLFSQGPGNFVLGVAIEGHIEGIALEQTQQLLEKAHEVCPYSKATRGNIEVTIKAV